MLQFLFSILKHFLKNKMGWWMVSQIYPEIYHSFFPDVLNSSQIAFSFSLRKLLYRWQWISLLFFIQIFVCLFYLHPRIFSLDREHWVDGSFSCSILSIIFHFHWVSMFHDENSAAIQIIASWLSCILFLWLLSSFFFFFFFWSLLIGNLIMMYLGMYFSRFTLFEIHWVSWSWWFIFINRFGKFSGIISLSIFSSL